MANPVSQYFNMVEEKTKLKGSYLIAGKENENIVPEISSFEPCTFFPAIFYTYANFYYRKINVCYYGTRLTFLPKNTILRYYQNDILKKYNFNFSVRQDDGRYVHQILSIVIGRQSFFILDQNTDQLLPLMLACYGRHNFFSESYSGGLTLVVNQKLLNDYKGHHFYNKLKMAVKIFTGEYSNVVFTNNIEELCFSYIPKIEYSNVRDLKEKLENTTEMVLKSYFPEMYLVEASSVEETTTETLIETLTETPIESLVENEALSSDQSFEEIIEENLIL